MRMILRISERQVWASGGLGDCVRHHLESEVTHPGHMVICGRVGPQSVSGRFYDDKTRPLFMVAAIIGAPLGAFLPQDRLACILSSSWAVTPGSRASPTLILLPCFGQLLPTCFFGMAAAMRVWRIFCDQHNWLITAPDYTQHVMDEWPRMRQQDSKPLHSAIWIVESCLPLSIQTKWHS